MFALGWVFSKLPSLTHPDKAVLFWILSLLITWAPLMNSIYFNSIYSSYFKQVCSIKKKTTNMRTFKVVFLRIIILIVTFSCTSYPIFLSYTGPVAEAAGDTNNLIYASPVILICSTQAPHFSLHLSHQSEQKHWPQSSSITFSPMAWWAARVTAMEPSRDVISPRRAYMVLDRPSPPATGTRFCFRTFDVPLSPPNKSILSREM